MELNFLYCLLLVSFTGVLAKFSYHTLPVQEPVRSTAFSPKIISKVCLLKPDEGPCRGNIRMYHFDPNVTNCTSFQWGGCQGNGNRFDSSRECLRTCLSQRDMSTQYRPRYCQLSFDYGFCFGALNRWYFDKFWKVCKQTLYSGCGGNKNNFYSFEQCDRICRLGKAPITTTTANGKERKVVIINSVNATTKSVQIRTSTKKP